MSEGALRAMYLDSHVPEGWAEGRRFGFDEAMRAITRLGSETGLVLPRKLAEEYFASCSCCRIHAGIKFGLFLCKRGIFADADPPVQLPPETTATTTSSSLLLGAAAVLALGIAARAFLPWA